MTNKEKDLILKDLCARLPYGTQVVYNGVTETLSTLHIFDMTHIKEEYVDIKPYLRPMSSMTEEEVKDLESISGGTVGNDTNFIFFAEDDYALDKLANIINWLNSHHFDYRGLIEKGLAIEVTESNNPYE